MYCPFLDLLGALGRQLIIYPPPEDQKIPVLNEVWRVVAKSEDIVMTFHIYTQIYTYTN